jgi:hypothetical protein
MLQQIPADLFFVILNEADERSIAALACTFKEAYSMCNDRRLWKKRVMAVLPPWDRAAFEVAFKTGLHPKNVWALRSIFSWTETATMIISHHGWACTEKLHLLRHSSSEHERTEYRKQYRTRQWSTTFSEQSFYCGTFVFKLSENLCDPLKGANKIGCGFLLSFGCPGNVQERANFHPDESRSAPVGYADESGLFRNEVDGIYAAWFGNGTCGDQIKRTMFSRDLNRVWHDNHMIAIDVIEAQLGRRDVLVTVFGSGENTESRTWRVTKVWTDEPFQIVASLHGGIRAKLISFEGRCFKGAPIVRGRTVGMNVPGKRKADLELV